MKYIYINKSKDEMIHIKCFNSIFPANINQDVVQSLKFKSLLNRQSGTIKANQINMSHNMVTGYKCLQTIVQC